VIYFLLERMGGVTVKTVWPGVVPSTLLKYHCPPAPLGSTRRLPMRRYSWSSDRKEVIFIIIYESSIVFCENSFQFVRIKVVLFYGIIKYIRIRIVLFFGIIEKISKNPETFHQIRINGSCRWNRTGLIQNH